MICSPTCLFYVWVLQSETSPLFFSPTPVPVIRGNRHKLKHRRYSLSTMKHLFIGRETQHWNRLPRDGQRVKSPVKSFSAEAHFCHQLASTRLLPFSFFEARSGFRVFGVARRKLRKYSLALINLEVNIASNLMIIALEIQHILLNLTGIKAVLEKTISFSSKWPNFCRQKTFYIY